MRHIPSEALLRDIRHVSELIGGTPTGADYDDLGAFSVTTIRDRFGSWNEALAELGLEPNRRYGIDREELLESIREVADQLGRTPTKDEYNHHSDYSVGAIRYRFETWRAAVEEAGLDPRPWGGRIRELEEIDPDLVPAGGDR